jgi:hypothetical protein
VTTPTALGDEPFVQLTTFRKTGVGVPTTVWVVRDGTTLYVTTPAGSGKVKRLRNNPAVELRPSSRRGRVEQSQPATPGVAQVHDDDASREHVHPLMQRKYGWEWRVAILIERLARRGSAGPARVILAITLA